MCVKSQTIQMGLQRRNMTNHLTRVVLLHACRETEWMVFASVDHMSNNTCNDVRFGICYLVKACRKETFFFFKTYTLNALIIPSSHYTSYKNGNFPSFWRIFFRLFSWSEISGKKKLDLQFFKNWWSIHLFIIKANE